MSNVLALDLGTHFGWATHIDDCLSSGNVQLKKKTRELQFAKFLQEYSAVVDTVVYEKVERHSGTQAAHVYGGLVAIVSFMCQTNDIKLIGVPVGTIKKYVTGYGNANKEFVLYKVNELLVLDITDHNEADAVALLMCYLHRS